MLTFFEAVIKTASVLGVRQQHTTPVMEASHAPTHLGVQKLGLDSYLVGTAGVTE